MKIIGDSQIELAPRVFKWRFNCTGVNGLPIDDEILKAFILENQDEQVIISPGCEFSGIAKRDAKRLRYAVERRAFHYEEKDRYFYSKTKYRNLSKEKRQEHVLYYLGLLDYYLTLNPRLIILPLSLRWFSRLFKRVNTYEQFLNRFRANAIPLDLLPLPTHGNQYKDIWADDAGHLTVQGYSLLTKIINNYLEGFHEKHH